MRDAQILILDEPTAALDARAEYEMFRHFAALTEHRIALLISHRFSTVRLADRIMVFAQGRLIEHGAHHELLELNGQYASLFRLQASFGDPREFPERRRRYSMIYPVTPNLPNGVTFSKTADGILLFVGDQSPVLVDWEQFQSILRSSDISGALRAVIAA